ncbi:MAG: hypothetical protein ACO1O1_04070 [Adhaeribacter sp.]
MQPLLPALALGFLLLAGCSGSRQGPAAASQTPATNLPAGAVPEASDGPARISRQRAEALLARLPAGDRWEKNPDASTLAWGESATLRALVNLYEATGEARYLEEVARRGDQLLSHRDDRRGVKDASGHSRPAWSMGSVYVVAKGSLADAGGQELLRLRSTPSSYNNQTQVEVLPEAGTAGRFTLKVSNAKHNRQETFAGLSLDPQDARYAAKVVNDPMAPYAARGGTYTDKPSNLVRVEVTGEKTARLKPQTVTLESIPLAYMGYLGVIYDPMLRFAELVKANRSLAKLLPAADRFIQAAETSYADAARRLWRSGPHAGEGYYLTCEKGESFPADNVGQPINFLGRHVCAELALYRLTGKPQYRDRAEQMARLLKNRLRHDPVKDLYVWNYWYEPMTTTGWKPQDNLSANVRYFPPAPYVEDISHGVLDVAMVVAAHRQGLVFDDRDVQRFANTLLHHVLLPDFSGVRRRVDGKGEAYAPYFPAAHGWLELAGADAAVYRGLRQAYEQWDKEDLGFVSALLKWERKLENVSGSR